VLVLCAAIGSGFLEWYAVISVLAAGFIAYLTIMCSMCQKKMKTLDRKLSVRLAEIKGLQDIYAGNVTIMTTEQLLDIERQVEKDIWIATFDLSYDMKYFLEVGKCNLERGVTYKYYLPKECRADFEELEANLVKIGANSDYFSTQHIARYVNSSLIPFNVVLYDPLSRKSGFIYSPQSDTNLYIAFDDEAFRQVRNYFKLLEKAHAGSNK
jgi:hypothetical protein